MCVSCWISRLPFYCACLAPVLLILLLNLVAFALVMVQLHRFSKPSSQVIDKTVHTSAALRLKGAFSVTILLGLTWLFAVFAVGGAASLVFHYLFAIFNTLQGLFIFIFYCLLKKDVMKAWRRQLSSQTTTSGSSKSEYTRHVTSEC